MTTVELPTQAASDSHSLFDAIRQVRTDGSEFWSARDLQPLLGYLKWQNFALVVADARRSADIVGTGQDQFTDSSKMVSVGSGAVREIADVELTRYGAYMVILAGDGRKPEIAAAKDYFAVQTRVAEAIQSNPALLTATTTELGIITPYEIGTLFSETRDEFTRVVTVETVDTPAAHALAHTMQTWAQIMAHQIIGTPLVHVDADVKYANVTEALPSLPKGDGDGEGVAPARLPFIPIAATVEEPITWDEFARTEGIPRCGPCAGGLSSRIKHFAVKNGYPRGRTALGHNVFPRALWKKFYEEWGNFYTDLHNDPARNHNGAHA